MKTHCPLLRWAGYRAAFCERVNSLGQTANRKFFFIQQHLAKQVIGSKKQHQVNYSINRIRKSRICTQVWCWLFSYFIAAKVNRFQNVELFQMPMPVPAPTFSKPHAAPYITGALVSKAVSAGTDSCVIVSGSIFLKKRF